MRAVAWWEWSGGGSNELWHWQTQAPKWAHGTSSLLVVRSGLCSPCCPMSSIVNQDKKIVGIGYNGFPNGCSDDLLPWARSADSELDTKYPCVMCVVSHMLVPTVRPRPLPDTCAMRR